MNMSEINLPMFKQDVRICIVTVLQCFLQRTSDIRHNETRLFISTIKPHVGFGRDTISRWTKYMLCKAGINMTIFSPYSTRSAGVSAAKVPLDTILRTAGWRSDCTFRKLSDKPVMSNMHFAKSVLSQYINMINNVDVLVLIK